MLFPSKEAWGFGIRRAQETIDKMNSPPTLLEETNNRGLEMSTLDSPLVTLQASVSHDEALSDTTIDDTTIFGGKNNSFHANFNTNVSSTANNFNTNVSNSSNIMGSFGRGVPKKGNSRSATRKNNRLSRMIKSSESSVAGVVEYNQVTDLSRSCRNALLTLRKILEKYNKKNYFLSEKLLNSILHLFSNHIESKWKKKLEHGPFDNNCVCYALLLVFPDVLIHKSMMEKINGVLTASQIIYSV